MSGAGRPGGAAQAATFPRAKGRSRGTPAAGRARHLPRRGLSARRGADTDTAARAPSRRGFRGRAGKVRSRTLLRRRVRHPGAPAAVHRRPAHAAGRAYDGLCPRPRGRAAAAGTPPCVDVGAAAGRRRIHALHFQARDPTPGAPVLAGHQAARHGPPPARPARLLPRRIAQQVLRMNGRIVAAARGNWLDRDWRSAPERQAKAARGGQIILGECPDRHSVLDWGGASIGPGRMPRQNLFAGPDGACGAAGAAPGPPERAAAAGSGLRAIPARPRAGRGSNIPHFHARRAAAVA